MALPPAVQETLERLARRRERQADVAKPQPATLPVGRRPPGAIWECAACGEFHLVPVETVRADLICLFCLPGRLQPVRDEDAIEEGWECIKHVRCRFAAIG